MKPTILNSITANQSKNFEKNIIKLLPKGVKEVYLSSCGIERLGAGSYNYFLDIAINGGEIFTLKSHTNDSCAWDSWKEIEAGSRKHDNFNKNVTLMLLNIQANFKRISEIVVVNLVTFEMCKTIKKGESLKLNDTHELYYYENGDSLVIMDSETYEELFWVQYNPDTKEIVFGEL